MRRSAYLGVIAVLTAGGAAAQQAVPGLNAYLTLSNSYWNRGLAQDYSGAAQLGIDYEHASGWLAGGRAATVDYPTEHYSANARETELGVYAGYHRRRERWSYTLSLGRYLYPGAANEFDYSELAASFGLRDRYFYTVTYSDDLYGLRRSAFNQEISIAVPLKGNLEIGAAVGRFDIDLRGADYTHWNVGVSKVWPRLALDLRYYDSDYAFATALGDPTATQYALSISYALRSRRPRG